MDTTQTPTALITGGTAGLGLAFAHALAATGWTVITNGRDPQRPGATEHPDTVHLVTGDLTDPAHRTELVAKVRTRGRLDLLMHNASTLGPVPMQALERATDEALEQVWQTNVAAPHRLTADLLPHLRAAGGVILSVSSDAAIQHYETWGLYGASKAALDHLTLTFAAETGLSGYAIDPGDMRTEMHQHAFLGEDISDRPLPETVVPHLLRLLQSRPDSGRYQAQELS